MKGISRAESIAREILEKKEGGFISERDGHIIIKINDNDETVIIWIRQRPITDKALTLFKKIINKHSYDKLVLLKLYDAADYIKYNELKIFDKITTQP